MTTTSMPLSAEDRRALRSYLRRFSWATRDYLGTPLRSVVRDLRRDIDEAAQDVGTTTALAGLGDPRELAERYADEHGRRGPRGARLVVRVAGSVLAVAAVVAAVVGVRALPRVEAVGASWTDPAFVLTPDAFAVTYVATDVDGPASHGFLVRNPGPFAETLTGVDTLVSHVGLVPGSRDGGLTEATIDAERQRSLTLAPGDLAFVRVDVFLAPCASYTAGNGIIVSEAALEVSTLGVRRTVTVPLGADYTVRTTVDRTAPAGCEPGAVG